MLKRCGNLPRLGIGFLGLGLVFLFNPTAHAASLRRSGTQTGSAIMAGVPAGANPANVTPSNPPAVLEFSSAGSGNVNFMELPPVDCTAAGLVCNSGESCQCLTMSGLVTDGLGPLYHGTASLLLNLVITFPGHVYPDGNNVGQYCFFASGLLAITPAPNSTVNLYTAGAACNGFLSGSLFYSGGFSIGPSTGGFSASTGSGTIGFGTNFFTDIGIFDVKGAGTGLN
jgi:hypothetical protein